MTFPPPPTARWARLCALAVLVGGAAGLGGVALTWLLHGIQWLAIGQAEHGFTDFSSAASAAPAWRRALAVIVGAGLAGVGWWWLRRTDRHATSVERARTTPDHAMPLGRTTVDACLQILVVATGSSVGREGAPRQLGAALGSWLARRGGARDNDVRRLLTAGAGAGLAAVYNVPLGGFFFAVEAIARWKDRGLAVPALIASVVATVTAWPFLGVRAQVYLLPTIHVDAVTWALAAGAGVVAGLVAVAFSRAVVVAVERAPQGRALVWRLPLAGAIVGMAAWWLPTILGNGKAMAQQVLTGAPTVGLVVALLVAKPLATTLTLHAGAAGGLLQPSFATGAAVGFLLGSVPGLEQHRPALAMVGAAVVLATTLSMPVTGVVLAIEFARAPVSLWLPMALATAIATVIALPCRRRSKVAAMTTEQAPSIDDQGRPEPPLGADERGTLLGFLDYQRATLEWKCRGLTDEQLRASLHPTAMTLAGLLAHMGTVEDFWFTRIVGEMPFPDCWPPETNQDPEWEWKAGTQLPGEELRSRWADAVERSRVVVDGVGDLGERHPFGDDGTPVSVRWVLTHMIEEYARHNGHADMLREAIDGETGE